MEPLGSSASSKVPPSCPRGNLAARLQAAGRTTPGIRSPQQDSIKNPAAESGRQRYRKASALAVRATCRRVSSSAGQGRSREAALCTGRHGQQRHQPAPGSRPQRPRSLGAPRAPQQRGGPPVGPRRGVARTGAPSATTALEHVLPSRSPGLSPERDWRPHTRDPTSGRRKGADWTRKGGRRGVRGAGPRISTPWGFGTLNPAARVCAQSSLCAEVLPLLAYDWSVRARRGCIGGSISTNHLRVRPRALWEM